MQSEPQTNSSAVISAGACGVAVLLAVIGLALSGSGRQVAEVAAVLAAIFGFGLGSRVSRSPAWERREWAWLWQP